MPRISRGLASGYTYHVLNRGNGGQVIFHKDKDYKVFIDIVKEAKERYNVKVFAYCLMPNHFHMVLMPSQGEELSKWMQWSMTSHVRRYHRHYGTTGHVWQGRYKSFPIEMDSHLLMVLRYVESNPLRAGIVFSAKDWLWSSYLETIGKRPSLLVDEIPIKLPKDWSRYVNDDWRKGELENLRQSVNRQTPYGNLTWRFQVVKEFGLESTIKPRGRPKSWIVDK